jgi:iron complex transport system substrate-binding protein
MEATPLGRAEWVKFMGLLYGQYNKADSIYSAVTMAYDSLKNMAANVHERPTVISEMVTDGVWFMPGGGSYMARVFADAGANYVWADDNSTGSLQLDFATVYDRARDADFWLIKTFGRDLTLAQLESDYALHARMKAFASGGVYSCNTGATSLFEDFPFHPEMLLKEYVKIFHGNLLPDYELKYYKSVK